MKEQLTQLEKEALNEVSAVISAEALYRLYVKYLGRKGKFTTIMQSIAQVPKNERPGAGQLCNAIKKSLEAAFEKKRGELETHEIERKLSDAWVDITAPGKRYEMGSLHPLSQVQYDVEQIFSDMGFAVMDGPEVESEYYNFEGLNIPAHHPARDMQDTFFINQPADKKHGRLVLRTHTSPVQVRTMEKYGAPLRIIVPGRVFRNEATDARHEHTFNQVEGLLIDTNISLAHLKGVMQEFLTRLFGRTMEVRFRPGYFPFVEPGIELDISCTLCKEKAKSRVAGVTKGGGMPSEPESSEGEAALQWGTVGSPQEKKGCRVCKYTGWLEFMGSGMVHPNVLKAGGIDSKKYQGWAFGFGLTRLAMMKYGIDDIRLLLGGDLRFLEQF